MLSISESLKRQREQVLQDGSEEALSRHTSLLEIAIISLYNRLVNRLNLNSEQFRSSGAVIALGAFGRGLIGPNQPVPILVLKTESLPWKEGWLEEISSPLEEAGWRVAVQQATVESLLNQAHEDFSFFLHLLESRYISGSRPLADQFEKALETFMDGRQDEFLHRLHDMCRQRCTRLDDPQNWLEPDLIENPGGLADILSVRAACRIASNITNLEDAIFRGYLTRQEVDMLQKAEKTFVRLISLLQNLGGDGASTLRFEEQETIAEKLGYSAPAGFLPVETFMQHLQQLFYGVGCMSREFWERLQEGRWGEESGESYPPSEELEEGLLVRSGKLVVQPDRYPAKAGCLIHLFALAAKHGLRFSNTTRQWIQHHRNALDTAAGDAAVSRELLDLVQADAPEAPVLRRFSDCGYLTSLIPELSPVYGLVQHDAFHVYPVHEHHLRTLTELKRLIRGDYDSTEPEITRVAQSIESPICLFLAGLLHDIGKSAGRDHELHGGEMIPTIARRLGLQPEESDMVQFLVAQHLLLNDSAAMRDLADEEMLARCALSIGTLERLDLLLLLSFADMAATGPKAKEKWMATPVVQLYERIRDLLERGEPSPQAIEERVANIRNLVARQVSDLMGVSELEMHFQELAPRYLLSTSPGAVAHHLRLEWELQHSEEPFVWKVAQSELSAELTIMSRERSGLLAQAAGVLSLHGMNIISSQVFTKKNGVVLLIFQCRLPEQEANWEAVRRDMLRLLKGRLALDYRIAAHAARLSSAETQPLSTTPSRVLIDNESSGLYTIVEVYTLDRVGLLYTIARTLQELQIKIYVAKITTKIDQVADVFYVTTHEGEKVTDPEQIDEIRCALLFWLDGPVPY